MSLTRRKRSLPAEEALSQSEASGGRCRRAAPGSSAARWCSASWAWHACAGYTWGRHPRQLEG